ncbi:hypothetical protein [Flavihumibacter petaseus]|uniref:Lipoprotein n=1 Tax=Flavihumibacter petaseus NBRC 106054 TaxID=1220578 RepID=A0A0E9MZ18_9BACT|nr:hypothetical protein [Flavihumibacter petaseus]GAO42854.1 hypothetical protein FPE01S_01_18720 [Flavihumibacter petaseus NBRC 106054]
MKKILLLLLPALLLLASCRREYTSPAIDESYWLSREKGGVRYSDGYCDYFVVETYYGYSVLRIWSGYTPLQGDVLYGDLNRYGTQTFYNRSAGTLIQADVREYWLTWYDAIDQINWFCSHP